MKWINHTCFINEIYFSFIKQDHSVHKYLRFPYTNLKDGQQKIAVGVESQSVEKNIGTEHWRY